MQRWSWIAAGATIGCALTLGAQFTLEKLRETNPPNQAPKRTTIATIGVQGDPSMGSLTAPVTIVEFSDFECPYCKRFHDETFPLLKKNYIDKGLVRFIHKDLPLPFHKNAYLAATTTRCAKEDGKYWEAYSAMFSQQNCLSCRGPLAIAADTTGANQAKLEKCSKGNRQIDKAVNINKSEADINGIRATPTFVIGGTAKNILRGRIIEGAIPWSDFKSIIDQTLLKTKSPQSAKRQAYS
jgi:protein-disulfide isomerase